MNFPLATDHKNTFGLLLSLLILCGQADRSCAQEPGPVNGLAGTPVQAEKPGAAPGLAETEDPAASRPHKRGSSGAENSGKQTKSASLLGEISTAKIHPFVGKWNGYIKSKNRHPKLVIESCDGRSIQGSFKGLLGTFPVTGQLTGSDTVVLHLDISQSPLAKRKHLSSASGVIEGTIKGNEMVGYVTIPELGSQRLSWKAVKDH